MGLAALLTVAMASVFSVTYWLGTSALFDAVNSAIVEQLELLAARPPGLLPFMITSRLNHQPKVITRVGLFDRDNHLVVGDIPKIPADIRWDGRVHPFEDISETEGASEHLRVAGRRLADGRLLIVGRDVSGLLDMQAALLRTLAVGLGAGAVVSLFVGVMFGIRADRRLQGLRHAAQRIVDGALSERLPQSGHGDELDELCAMMNRILDRLEEMVAAWKWVGEDIAHEIRTPLTAVRARLERARLQHGPEMGRQALVEGALTGLDEALTVITALLRIAEIERGRRCEAFKTFDLAAVVSEVSETFEPVAEDAGVILVTKIGAPAMVRGDRDLLVEVVVNLVDNAVKFAGTEHRVAVELFSAPAGPILTVSDDGPGIPELERERVFRRFYRGERGRTAAGNGLGLSLVASIARLHDFGVAIEDNSPGCRVIMHCFPAAQGQTRRSERAML